LVCDEKVKGPAQAKLGRATLQSCDGCEFLATRPDVHWGIGATVGSVIPTRGAIIPAAVGVDIGCGMMAGSRSSWLS